GHGQVPAAARGVRAAAPRLADGGPGGRGADLPRVAREGGLRGAAVLAGPRPTGPAAGGVRLVLCGQPARPRGARSARPEPLGTGLAEGAAAGTAGRADLRLRLDGGEPRQRRRPAP